MNQAVHPPKNRSNRIAIVMGIGILAAFVFCVVHLFFLRFQKGDIYPVYSSLRTDPLGTKALYESFELCQGVAVERNYLPLMKLDAPAQSVLFYLGAEEWMDEDSIEDLDSFVRRGGRLIIAFLPGHPAEAMGNDKSEQKSDDSSKKEEPSKLKNDDSKKTNKEETGKVSPKTEQEKKDDKKNKKDRPKATGLKDTHFASLPGKWGFEIGFFPVADEEKDEIEIIRQASENANPSLPVSIQCGANHYFNKLDKAWKVIYSSKNNPVLIERPLNNGTIVLTSLSYLLSNEGLHEERYPDLLTWLVNEKKNIVFDESHFGMSKKTGLADLGKEYHLQWVALGLIILALLYIWRNAFSIVPPEEESAEESSMRAKGKESAAGLINLLQRNISSSAILNACFEEWKRSNLHSKINLKAKVSRMEEVLLEEQNRPIQKKDPIKTYQMLHQILTERK